ncbi:MAG: acyl carrier protein [Pseudomonadota bacterium]
MTKNPERTGDAAALIEFLGKEDMAGRKVEPDEELLETGALDSLKIMALVAFVEDRTGQKVALEDIVPETFGSVSAITAYMAASNSA